MNHYDIVIVGGGPAGLTFARNINDSYHVLLVDKKAFSSKINKACGGLLAPDAQIELSRQKLILPKNILVTPQLFNVKTIDYTNSYIRYYPRHYINIDRYKFDNYLLSLIGKNIEIKDKTILKNISVDKEKYILELNCNGQKEEISTKYLIGADGSNSVVRKTIIKNDKIARYICIQEWYKCKSDFTSYGAIFDPKVTDYYSWYIQKEKELIIGSALHQGKDSNTKFEYLKERFKEFNFKDTTLIKREGSFLSRPKRFSDIKFYSRNILLLGEASGLVSPSSGEGISYALHSGAVLAKVFNQNEKQIGKRYSRKMLKVKIKIIFKNIKSIVIYNKTLRKIIMKLKLTAIKDI